MDLNGKKIFITGGTGFIGSALHQQLIICGAKIFILSRNIKKNNDPDTVYIAAISDIGMIKPEIIINLAGEPIAQRWTETAKKKILLSRMQITKDIVEYIRVADHKPAIFISGSAIGYYGTDNTAEFNETSSPLLVGEQFAHSLCAQWEAAALQAKEYGVRTILLRIGVVLEKNGGLLKKLFLPFFLGFGGPIGSGQQWVSWIDRDDLIRLILYIINNNEINGPVNATAPNPVSNKIFSQELAKALHRPCLITSPGFALRIIFGQMAQEIMLQGQKVLPQKALQAGFVFLYPTVGLSLKKVFSTMNSKNSK